MVGQYLIMDLLLGHSPNTNTLHEVMTQLPLTAKGINSIEAIKGA